MKKKIMTIALSIAIISILIVGTSLAYFTDTQNTKNVFTVGNVKINLEESKWNPEVAHVIVPGAAFDKDPVVTNTGKNDAYLRVKIEISPATELSEVFPSWAGAIENGAIVGFNPDKWETTMTTDVVSLNKRLVTLYYKGELAPTDKVSVFTGIKVPSALNNDAFEDLTVDPTITIFAEAIQADGFTNVTEAFAAFDLQ